MLGAAGSSIRPYFFLGRVIGAALVAVAATVASAGTFTANPVRLSIAPGATSTSLLLENRGDEPVLVQAEVMAWSQQGGKDILTPTQDVVVSPPIFKVATGASQTVRVGLLRGHTGDREATYRVFLQEVPQPPPPGQQGVSVALRLGLPLFVQPKGKVAPQVVWRARRAGGAIELSLANTGNAHVQAIDCVLRREDGTPIAEQQLGAYVLAGESRSWKITPAQPWSGGKLRLSARLSSGEVTADITPD